MRIAILEDEIIFIERVSAYCNHHKISYDVYKDPFELLTTIARGERFDLIIADRFVAGIDTVEDNFKEDLTQLGYVGPIVLYTDATPKDERAAVFAGTIPKSLSGLPQFERRLGTILKKTVGFY